MRDSFIFYRSFYEAIQNLDYDCKCSIMEAIFEYALNQNEIELTGTAKAVWILMKPQIDANQRRFENGQKGGDFGKLGGRPKTPRKPLENPTQTPNENVNVNENVNNFMSNWNKLADITGLPKVIKLSDKRKAHLKARLKEAQFRDNLNQLFTLIANSKFLTGNNDREWKIDIDWLIANDTNYIKVLEGKYK